MNLIRNLYKKIKARSAKKQIRHPQIGDIMSVAYKEKPYIILYKYDGKLYNRIHDETCRQTDTCNKNG